MIVTSWGPLRNAVHPDSEARYETGMNAGAVVVSLYPEWTRDGNKHKMWVWNIHAARNLPQRIGHTFGADADKEVARQQADRAIVALGYEVL